METPRLPIVQDALQLSSIVVADAVCYFTSHLPSDRHLIVPLKISQSRLNFSGKFPSF
jgi:hypothetical protein